MDEGRVNRDEILPLLGPGKKQGAWRMAFCPAHADGQKHNGKGGYSLGLSDDGVLKCFAGCKFKDVMNALRQRSGVRAEPRQRRQERQARPAQESRGDLKVEYDYRDAVTGDLIAVKGRFEKPLAGGKPEKTFRWRLPTGTYEQGLRGKKLSGMPLWGAYELMNAPLEQRVWFAEGEKATEAIRRKGELALCGGWGAGSREADDFGDAFEVLRGRDVILWPDNDVPGREYMAAVRRHIRDIAASVAVVTAPVPPKGDAYEYFQAGGTVDALLSDVVTKTTTDILALDHFRVRVPTEAGVVSFDFEGVSKQGRDMSCELTVRHLAPDAEPEPYSQRINLLSQSARGQIETALRKQFDKDIKWTAVVSAAWAAVRDAFSNQDRGIRMGSAPRVEKTTFHIETLFPEGQPTILFGDGGSNKTYLSYAAGAAIALGSSSFGGLAVRRRCGVLVFDYETGAAQARFRFTRILRGMGIDDEIMEDALNLFHYWPANGVPLADQVEALCRYIDRHDIGFVIIDSGADACGGEPEKAGPTLEYFNALSRVPATTVTICHVTTDSDGSAVTGRPFGCHDEETEVLTRRGWLRHADMEDGDEVACYDVRDRVLRWERPTVRHRYRFDGEMVAIRGASLDLRVTPNHRMWVRPSYDGRWRERLAGGLNGTTVMLPYASGLADDDEPDADVAFLDYLGWWLAEGSLDGNAPILTQAVGELAQRFLATTEALGFESSIVKPRPRDGERQCWQIRARGAAGFGEWLAEECGRGAANKRIPDVVWGLNRSAMRRLLFALMDGDGHWDNESRGSYATTSEQLADDVQRLAILAGFSARVRFLGRAQAHHHDRYAVYIGSRREIEVRGSRHLSRQEYRGFVYCLTVPSGAYVTRRNGYMAVTMNSKFWHNRARRTWYVNRVSEEESDELDIGLLCRKVNDGRLAAPLSFRVSFAGDSGPVRFARQDFASVQAFEGERPLYERIRSALGTLGAMTTKALADELSVKDGVIRATLRRYEGTTFIRVAKGSGRGNTTTWGLKAHGLL